MELFKYFNKLGLAYLSSCGAAWRGVAWHGATVAVLSCARVMSLREDGEIAARLAQFGLWRLTFSTFGSGLQ